MRQKYTNLIAYYFPRLEDDNDISYSQIGQSFYCNREIKNKSSLNPMTGTYMTSVNEIVKTTTQLNFKEHGRISFKANATDDEYSMIIAINVKPLLDRGAKYRNGSLNEYWITIA